jgi:hypothetical protein
MFFAFFFFFISLLVQFPFVLLHQYLKDFLSTGFFSVAFLIITQNILSESIKYYSLKRKLKTRSIKNALLFGLTWVCLESLSFISLYVFSFFAQFFSLSLSLPFSTIIPFWSFIVLFAANSVITTYIIVAIVKRKKQYFYFGLLYTLLFSFIFLFSLRPWFIDFGIIVFSFLIIYHFKLFFK